MPLPLLFALAFLQDPHDLSSRFEVDPGLQVTLWAESPQLFNPTAIDVDWRGRIWVAEAVNYRKWRGRNPGLAHPDGDRIVILDDTDGDGICDSSKVFAQDKDLVAPLGIAVLGDEVIVSCSPTAWIYRDTNGDDVADEKEPFLTGFGGHDHDHGLHSFVGGPDGAWWFSIGNAGPHIVTDRAGWTLRSGSIYRDGGAEPADNKPGLVSDDGRVWTGGLNLRVLPDGTSLAVRAHNFRNQYEVALDSFGNMFTEDNDDEVVTCRTVWCMEGGNHGFFAADGSRTWQADRRPGQSTWEAHWHVDDPGVVPPGTNNGSGGPTGVVVYEGQSFPKRFHGAVLNADAGASVVYAHTPVANGAGYDLQPGFLLKPRTGEGFDEEAHLFRPSDVAVGLDGSVYVADWFDPGVGGHAMADAKGYGRILRVWARGSRGNNPRMGFDSLESQLSALCSPAVNVRWQAFQLVAAQGESAVKRLKGFLVAPNKRFVARALWLLARASDEGRAAVREMLSNADPELRITAFRTLRAAGMDVRDTAKLLQSEESPAVLRELAIALRDVRLEPSDEAFWFGKLLALPLDDRAYLEAIGIGASGREARIFELARGWAAQSPGGAEHGRALPEASFADLAWRLHVPEALPQLLHFATSADPARRKRAVDAIAFIGTREAAEAMLQLALAGPPELREQASWWVRFRDTNDWRDYHLASQLGEVERANSKLAWSSGAMKKGLVGFAVDLSSAEHVLLVVTPSSNGIDFDWADWIEPRFEGAGTKWKLSELGWTRAKGGWGTTQVGHDCEGGELDIDTLKFADGIGTHAESEIVFRVPPGATKLVGRCGPDNGGAKREGTRCEVEFQVYLDLPAERGTLDPSLKRVIDASASEGEREKAALELVRSSEGALALVHFAAEGKLAESLRARVSAPLLAHADPAVRALAAAQFRTGAASEEPSLDAILSLGGDRRRGEKVFFGAAATCSQCHSVRGRGGDVGPDLSEIRRKYGAREMLDHVLHPNKAVEFGYQTWTVETDDGRIHTGFLQAGDLLKPGDGVVVLKGTDGKRATFAESEVASARRQEISVMPDNVALGLAPRELADLSAFLQFDPSTPPKLGAPVTLFDGHSLEGWGFFLEDPKLQMKDVWSVRDGAIHCAGKPAGYLKSAREFESFVLELDWRWDPAQAPSNSGVLLRQSGPDQIWPRAIEAQLMHRNAGDIWNIGEFPMQVDRARTEGRHTEKLAPSNEKPIGEWNHYKITLDGGDLTLEVNGLVQNRATWCDTLAGPICLQSEGSAIEFKNVVVTPIVD